jgi:hypothetical protein
MSAYARNNPISVVDFDGTVSVNITGPSFRTVRDWADLSIAARQAGGSAGYWDNGFTGGRMAATCECASDGCGRYRPKVTINADIFVVAVDNPSAMVSPGMTFVQELIHVIDRLELISRLKSYGGQLEDQSYKYKLSCELDCALFEAYAKIGMTALQTRDWWPRNQHPPVRRPQIRWSR